MGARRTSTHRAAVGALVAATLFVAACGSSGDDATPATTNTLAPLQPSTPGEATATSATVAGGSGSPIVLPDTCAWTAPTPGGTVTFVTGGRLYELSGDGAVDCLTDVGGDESGPVRWSPDATRVLLGGSVEATAFGRLTTGYFATNPDVTWSEPTGKALIAPSVNDGTLIWRDSADSSNRIDISFLADTVAAAYHPAGKAIAAIGTDETGSTGLYLATNRGENRKQLTFAENPDDAKLTELAFGADGTEIYFLHQHAGMYHVHQLVIDGIQLTDVVEEEGTADHLVTSTTRNGDVAWQRTVGDTHTVQAIFDRGQVQTFSGDEATTSLEPVGWWGDRVVVLEHAPGSSHDGALWVWAPNSEPIQLTAGVERAAVRVERGPFVELPTEITQQAVG